MNHLRSRNEYTLPEIKERWKASWSELRNWLYSGDLVAHVWLPVMSAYKTNHRIEGGRILSIQELSHWEGHIPISRHFHHRLFKFGKVSIRDFTCPDTHELYSIPGSVEDVIINFEDLVIFNEDRNRHEAKLRKGGEPIRPERPTASNDALRSRNGCMDANCKIVQCQDQTYHFGDMQAAIIRLLREAALSGEPWQSGKRLLQKVGSQSYSLSNVFKKHPIWRELIVSDRRGSYRLHHEWAS